MDKKSIKTILMLSMGSFVLYFLIGIFFDFLLHDDTNYQKLTLYSATFAVMWTIVLKRKASKKQK